MGNCHNKDIFKSALTALDSQGLVKLLKKMVGFPSYSRSREEREIALFLFDYLKQTGIDVQLQEVEEKRFNVIGRLSGTGGGKSLLFNGHLDINSPAEGWTKDPFAGLVEDGYMYGMGVVNMKAGDAAFIMAAEAIQKTGIRLKGDVILSLVVGELQGGIGTIHMLEQGMTADAFIVAEPTELLVLTRHMGMVHVDIIAIGRSCHLSSKEKGLSAIESMYEIISSIEKSTETSHTKLFERFNVGAIRGGLSEQCHSWRPSLVPDYCVAACDFRIPPGQSEERLIKELQEITEKIKDKKTGLEIRVELLKPPRYYHMPPFEVNDEEEIVKTVMENHRIVTGKEPRIAHFPPYLFYASDASHLHMKGYIPGVVYGPGGATVSQPDERVLLEDVIAASKVYMLSIIKTCS